MPGSLPGWPAQLLHNGYSHVYHEQHAHNDIHWAQNLLLTTHSPLLLHCTDHYNTLLVFPASSSIILSYKMGTQACGASSFGHAEVALCICPVHRTQHLLQRLGCTTKQIWSAESPVLPGGGEMRLEREEAIVAVLAQALQEFRPVSYALSRRHNAATGNSIFYMYIA